MRLARFIVRRFKSLEEVEISIPKTDEARPGSANFVSIVGENNVGKSSILEALNLACPGGDLAQPSLEHFPHGIEPQEDKPIEVEFHFDDVTEQDKTKHAIRSHVFEGLYRIKKIWRKPGVKPEHYAFAPTFTFPSTEGIKTREDLARHADWSAALAEYDRREKNDFTRINKNVVSELEQIAIDLEFPWVTRGAPTWTLNPGGIRANLDAVLPRVIFVPALQPTGDVADVSKRSSSVRKIVTMMFDEQLADHETVAAFRFAALRVEELFASSAKHEVVSGVERLITEKLSELINIGASLRFSAPDVGADLAGKTELFIRDGNIETRPGHQGHGAQRALVLALLQLLAEQERPKQDEDPQRPILLLVEEPEIYLHPEMCRKMRDALLRIARRGTAQVICTTHSPVFIDLADRHDGIVMLRKRSTLAPKVTQRSDDIFGNSPQEQRERLRMILNFDASANEAFFTDNAVLVEGDSEIAAVDAMADSLIRAGRILRQSYLLHRRRLTLVNCRGKGTIVAFQEVLNAFEVPYRVVHDEDSPDDLAGANAQLTMLLDSPGPATRTGNRTQTVNASILGLLSGGEASRLVHRPNFEQQIFGEVWADDKPWRTVVALRRLRTMVGPPQRFFEFVLRCSIEDLGERQPLHGSAVDAHVRPKVVPPGRRDRLKRIDLRTVRPQGTCSTCDFLAEDGPRVSLVEDLDVQGQRYQTAEYGNVLVVRVVGNSMAATMTGEDLVVVRRVPNVVLDPIEEGSVPVRFGDFARRIWNDGIYVMSMNRAIDRGRYAVRRVRLEELSNRGWNCRISSDNPSVPMDRYRDVNVRRSDRARFIAQLVGFAEVAPEDNAVLGPSGPEVQGGTTAQTGFSWAR